MVHAYPAAQAPNADLSQAESAVQIDRLIKEADADIAAGAFDATASAAESAVALSRAAGDRARLAQALYRLAQGRFYQSRNAEAISINREVLDLATSLGDRTLRARALNGIGVAHRELGEYDQAIEFLTQALAAHRKLGNRVEQVRVQRNIAVLYWQLGDLARAEQLIRGAADLAAATGDKTYQAVTLQAWGAMVLDAGRPRQALAIEERALKIAQALNMPALLIDLGVSIGDAAAATGDFARALESYKGTLDASERAGYVIGQAVAASHIGAVYRDKGRLDEAMPWLMRARASFAALGGTTHLPNALANEFLVARTLRDEGRTDEALLTYYSAMDMVDRMRRAAVPIETATASVNAARSQLFVDTAALLVKAGRSEEAFAVAERYHARAFLDSLAASRVDARGELSPAERDSQRDLLARAAGLQQQLWKPDLPADRRRQLDAELSSVDDEFERVAGAVRRRSRSYAVHDPQVLDAGAVRARLEGEGTVLVEYMLGDQQSLVWAVAHDGVRVAKLPGRAALAPIINRYRTRVSTRASVLTIDRALADVDRAAADLYAAILEPIRTSIDRADRLIVVADGPLTSIPFEALKARRNQDAWLVDRAAVSYAPSASALFAIAAPRGGPAPAHDLLAVGNPVTATDPPLPYTRDEVEAIAALFKASRPTVLLGVDAREDRVKAAALPSYRYLHFAVHGRLDSTNPARSGLVLSRDPKEADDGVLQTREIVQLKLNADLVTLSACETGLGRFVRGEGVMGLARAFFYAGARSVVVSLWDVNDAATPPLMRDFYAGLRRGLDGAAALRAAKRARAHGATRVRRHPYFWAPFVFTGPASPAV